jgi:hypothetical protein
MVDFRWKRIRCDLRSAIRAQETNRMICGSRANGNVGKSSLVRLLYLVNVYFGRDGQLQYFADGRC